MERLYGPSMVDLLGRRPWTVKKQGALLADLHRRLHDLRAPEWVGNAPGVAGEQLVHLDLHPLNVMMTAQGPIVIDWPAAARGDGNTDVALTWVLLSAGQIPGARIKGAVLSRFRSLLISSFVGQFDRGQVTAHLRGVVDWKILDPHMSPREQQAMRRLVDRASSDDRAG